MSKFTVERDVLVKQAVIVTAPNASKAIELSRKLNFKDWSTLNRSKRTNYTTKEHNS